MQELTERRIKGITLFVVLVGSALGMLVEPGLGVTGVIATKTGVGSSWLAAVFIVSGLMNLFHGWTGRPWNALWFAAIGFYVGFTWYAALTVLPIPAVTLLFYTAFCIFLAIDFVKDWKAYYA